MSSSGEPGAALPPEAYLVALAGLPSIGPNRLTALVRDRAPEAAWQLVVGPGDLASVLRRSTRGTVDDLAARWRRVAGELDPGHEWCRHQAAGCTVLAHGHPDEPARLARDLEPPAVLFARGDLSAADGPCVAVVGTRRCTRYGLDVAFELGHDLAAAGVAVVSGLALGIDGAAHRGALSALDTVGEGAGAVGPPVGVVASGLDTVYPRQHGVLWRRVAEAGLLLSEVPLGHRPEAWRFPARNRVIAALADLVVVVETGERGGSLHTVDEAVERGVPVGAVPGAVRSPSSAGTNRLLADGAVVVRDARDVLDRLGLDRAEAPRLPGIDVPEPTQPRVRAVLGALGWVPAGLDELVRRTGLDPAEVAVVVASLEADGVVERRGGSVERRAVRHG